MDGVDKLESLMTDYKTWASVSNYFYSTLKSILDYCLVIPSILLGFQKQFSGAFLIHLRAGSQRGAMFFCL